MTYNEELSCKLAKEMSDLWCECKIRCERIEEIVKQIKEIDPKEEIRIDE